MRQRSGKTKESPSDGGDDVFTPPKKTRQRDELPDNMSRDEYVAKFTEAVHLEQKALMRENEPIWRCRCSRSTLCAVCIWMLLAVAVMLLLSRAQTYKLSLVPVQEEETRAVRGTDALPDGCRGSWCERDGGREAFGVMLGQHNGVFAYSNCYSHTCVSMMDNEIEVRAPPDSAPRKMVSGMRWQCVEYARRYWMLRGEPQPAYFGSVDGAADIWTELTEVRLLDGTRTPLLRYGNGEPVGHGGSRPRVGDLLIYPRDVGDDGKPVVFPFGHVAVLVGVDPIAGKVFIAEQNWVSLPWPGPFHNYSRELVLQTSYDESGTRPRYTIEDPYHRIQGWVRYAQYED